VGTLGGGRGARSVSFAICRVMRARRELDKPSHADDVAARTPAVAPLIFKNFLREALIVWRRR
jgi:hypothetical protein